MDGPVRVTEGARRCAAAEVLVRIDAPPGSHVWTVDDAACEPCGRRDGGDAAADERTVRVDILTAADRRRVYARLARDHAAHAGPSGGGRRSDGEPTDAAGESRAEKGVGVGWMLVLAGVLVSLATGAGQAGSPVTAGVAVGATAAATGGFLALAPVRFWAKWTLGGVGVAAAATVLLLLFTEAVRAGTALLSAGIASGGFVAAATAVSLRMPWRARPQRGARRTPHQDEEGA